MLQLAGSILSLHPTLALGGSFAISIVCGKGPQRDTTDLDLRLPCSDSSKTWDVPKMEGTVRDALAAAGLADWVVVPLCQLGCKHVLARLAHGTGHPEAALPWGEGPRCATCAGWDALYRARPSAVTTVLAVPTPESNRAHLCRLVHAWRPDAEALPDWVTQALAASVPVQFVSGQLHATQPLSVAQSAFITAGACGVPVVAAGMATPTEEVAPPPTPPPGAVPATTRHPIALYSSLDITRTYRLLGDGSWYIGEGDEVRACLLLLQACSVWLRV